MAGGSGVRQVRGGRAAGAAPACAAGLKENGGPFYVACGQLKGPQAAEELQGAKIRYWG